MIRLLSILENDFVSMIISLHYMYVFFKLKNREHRHRHYLVVLKDIVRDLKAKFQNQSGRNYKVAFFYSNKCKIQLKSYMYSWCFLLWSVVLYLLYIMCESCDLLLYMALLSVSLCWFDTVKQWTCLFCYGYKF